MIKLNKAITLIALVVTIVVLLILAGVTLKLVLDNNGIIQKSKEARSETIVADEKSKVEMAYLSAALKKLGDTVTAEELQEELDSSVGAGKTVVTSNGDGTLNVLFNEIGHNYNVDEGTVEKVEIDNTKMAKLRNIMDNADVYYQTSELGKVDAGGGGTIAYILANYGMNVIDSGIAVLNMHAPYEIISKADLYETYRGYKEFLKNA